MSQSPEEIRTQIDSTRGRLGNDVDALADKVSPSGIAHRQTEKVRSSVGRVRERIMGSADDSGDTARHAAREAGEAVGDLPETVTGKTQGNPLAAGLIAFGAGWLLSALIPASESEKQAAATVKEKAQPLMQNAGEMAKAIADDMKEPGQQAVDQVKDTAQDSMENIKSEGASAAEDVKDRAQVGQDRVQRSAQSPGSGTSI
ncbi:MAG: DUF3618 domain-containing protein [Actinomycetota bacterium]|nr:DUF3618 domain-containing protein [Actinomycetota bacterium]